MKQARPIIAIDGPAGSGKSTVARRLAKELGFTYLNTGAMYRAVAIAFKDAGITGNDAKDEGRISGVLGMIKIEFKDESVFLNDRDVTAIISTPEISELASTYSTLPAVRARMRELQRAIGAQGGIVMEGRDIGTVVFPDAEFKFYFEASPEVRAERRYEELTAKGAAVNRNEVLSELIERDRRDSAREHAPMRRADDAVAIDTSKLTIEQVLSAMKERIQGVYVRSRP
jgi:CMP/dCMP kinase